MEGAGLAGPSWVVKRDRTLVTVLRASCLMGLASREGLGDGDTSQGD